MIHNYTKLAILLSISDILLYFRVYKTPSLMARDPPSLL